MVSKKAVVSCLSLVLGVFFMIQGVRPALADADSWYEKVKFSGDLRYRFENINEDKKAERDRQRIRVRLNLDAPLDDYWKAKLQLATGGLTDPVSTNQTLGEFFNRKTIDLSQAYLEYKVLFNNAKLSAGKVPNPFLNVGGNQLIWDGDLTFDGISGNANVDLAKDLNFFFNGGGFWIAERDATCDPMLYGGQWGLKGKFFDIKYTVGGSYYLYKDAKGLTTFVDAAKSFGNTVQGSAYRYNYKLAEGFLELGLNLFNLPFALYGNAVKNMDDAVSVRNTGVNFGLNVNKVKGEGTWAAGYYYRKLDRDAVVGAYSDSDFGGGGTDSAGHVFQAAYGITDSVTVKAAHFSNQKKYDLAASRIGYHRSQIDLELKF